MDTVGLLLVVLGLCVAGAGAYWVRQAAAFRRRAVRVPGVVVRLREQTSDESVLHYPTLRFTTTLGRQVETESRFGSSPAPARPGDLVAVLYDPDDPTRAQLAGRPAGGCLGAGFLLVGLTTAATGAGLVAAAS